VPKFIQIIGLKIGMQREVMELHGVCGSFTCNLCVIQVFTFLLCTLYRLLFGLVLFVLWSIDFSI